jgi:uncharacterized protein (TIGR00255 family)
MTGYGKAECKLRHSAFTIEIKSLNSKQLDLSIKVPVALRDREMEIRNRVSKTLQRGKIEVGIFQESSEDSTAYKVNQRLIRDYIQQLKEIAVSEGMKEDSRLLQTAMRMPEVIRSEKDAISEADWEMLSGVIGNALEALQRFRQQEGEAMDKDIRERVENILDLLARVEPFEKKREEQVRARLENSLQELQVTNGSDPGRLEQEMIFYLDKMDITEEKVRLQNHCTYFIETMNAEGGQGKKLGFISQETAPRQQMRRSRNWSFR